MKIKKIGILLFCLTLTSCSNRLFLAKCVFAKENNISIFRVNVDLYIGTFQQADVVKISATGTGTTSAFIYRLAGNKMFLSTDGYELKVYCNSEFCNLQEGYKKEYITLNDISIIYERYIDYLDDTLDESVIDYCDYLSSISDELSVDKDGRLNEMRSYYNYGEYNDTKVYLYKKYVNKDEAKIKKTIIGGFEFSYYSQDVIKVKKNEKFYDLDDAYYSGLITKDNLQKIHYTHNKSYIIYT